MSADAIADVVSLYSRLFGWDLSPHNLRRTFAKPAWSGQAPLGQLEERLHDDCRRRWTGAQNLALTIDRDKAEYHLARLNASPTQDAAKGLKDLLESRMPEVELVEALIDVDNDTDFLRHFLQTGNSRRLPRLCCAAMCWPPWSPSAATSVQLAWPQPGQLRHAPADESPLRTR